jgi:RING finger protein 113A
MRVSIRVDYAPDICKDYKDTGYCGYGDACKFMHDRGEHKAGWQLDREWDEKEKREAEAKRKAEAWAAGKGDGDDDRATAEDDDDGLPFACLLCKRAWTREAAPVVTRCGHYFCEACALSHHAAGGGRCASCQATTGGTFNVANAILKKLARVERERKG